MKTFSRIKLKPAMAALVVASTLITAGCAGFGSRDKTEVDAPLQQMQSLNGDAKISQSWTAP